MDGKLLRADIQGKGTGLTNQSDRMLAKGRPAMSGTQLGGGEELDQITRVGGWLSRILGITGPVTGPKEEA